MIERYINIRCASKDIYLSISTSPDITTAALNKRIETIKAKLPKGSATPETLFILLELMRTEYTDWQIALATDTMLTPIILDTAIEEKVKKPYTGKPRGRKPSVKAEVAEPEPEASKRPKPTTEEVMANLHAIEARRREREQANGKC